MYIRMSWFLMKIFFGFCHPAVVSFWCKTCKTGKKKNFFDHAHAQPQKSAPAHKRGLQKICFKPPHDGYKKAEFYVDFKNI
jgi:hypothetical protein